MREKSQQKCRYFAIDSWTLETYENKKSTNNISTNAIMIGWIVSSVVRARSKRCEPGLAVRGSYNPPEHTTFDSTLSST